jgi:hypothetical protein
MQNKVFPGASIVTIDKWTPLLVYRCLIRNAYRIYRFFSASKIPALALRQRVDLQHLPNKLGMELYTQPEIYISSSLILSLCSKKSTQPPGE